MSCKAHLLAVTPMFCQSLKNVTIIKYKKIKFSSRIYLFFFADFKVNLIFMDEVGGGGNQTPTRFGLCSIRKFERWFWKALINFMEGILIDT